MDIQKMLDGLRSQREKIAAETHQRIERLNHAIMALKELQSLNGTPKIEPQQIEPQPPMMAEGRPVKKGTPHMWVRRREKGAMILKRLGMHYWDVAIDAIRKNGRPVTTEEIYQHLQKLAGKRLPRKVYMERLCVSLGYGVKRGFLTSKPVGGTTPKKNLWNVAAATQLQADEIAAAEVK